MIIRSIALLMVSLTFACAEESDILEKRVSMGFQGMRGKREFLSDELSKRAPMGFQGMRGKKSLESELAEAIDKRAPMGFQGTRGKKDPLASLEYYDYEKRAPMGFQGMRGKKEDYRKRAPMGFQGMRGKKSLEQILDELKERRFLDPRENYINSDYPEEKRWYQGVCDENDDPAEWEKRAPMGFQGTRGKKIILDALEELEKRDMDFQVSKLLANFPLGRDTLYVALQGLRGKKDPFDDYLDYSISPSDYEKRAMDLRDSEGSESFKRARIGFHGMRGKRDAAKIYGSNSSIARTTMGYRQGSDRENELAAYGIDKRSPFRYLGARGKKNPRWEFRGKFVGVRGKKSSSGTVERVF
ncbi:tachykinin isoform X1 [Megachile rotundata]|uniref:tachykinin isoform X1 n=1 Tax=Megachile rotundata TaxID=143995 RepID=UPI003FD620F9